MADDVLKVPVLKLEIPRPRFWDLVAGGITLGGLATCAANLAASGIVRPGASISTSLSVLFMVVGLAVCVGSLLVLGKTAKEGTIHGNLLALAGMFIGLGGAMLAAALWALA